MTSFTKKAIPRILDLGLEKALRRWKANAKIDKVMFHERLLILMLLGEMSCLKEVMKAIVHYLIQMVLQTKPTIRYPV